MERKISSTNFINQSFLEERCPLNELMHFLSKRWTTEVLFSVAEGNIRFTDIKRDLQCISDQVLAGRLKWLEAYAFIGKISTDNGRKVSYQLTARGKDLTTVLGKLGTFAENSMVRSQLPA